MEKIALAPPKKAKPNDAIQVEVLEALPGRPIKGVRVVRLDGTISLGYYGDVQVAGLDRNQIKAKVVNHLRKFLSDEALGLFAMEPGPDGSPVGRSRSIFMGKKCSSESSRLTLTGSLSTMTRSLKRLPHPLTHN